MASKLLTRPYDADNAGGVSVAQAEIDFSLAAARQLICSVPANSVILKAWVEVVTAFNAGSTNLITVGYGAVGDATADDYVPNVTEGTPGVYEGTGVFPVEAAARDFYAYYTPTGTAPTTGKAYAFIMFSRLAANGQ